MFHLCRSNVYQNPQNVYFNTELKIESTDDLKEATKFDYVISRFKNNYRSLENFQQCDVIVHEYDNAHSENQFDWVTIKQCKESLYAGIECFYLTTRSNYKAKGDKAPRPKFRVFMPVRVIDKLEEYNKIKEHLKEQFPLCDHSALDASRFFFGYDNPDTVDYTPGVDVLSWAAARWDLMHGKLDLKDIDAPIYHEPDKVTDNRNSNLKAYAGHILFEYKDKTKEEFFDALWKWNGEHCEPPLTEKEIKETVLKSSWRQLKKHIKEKQIEAIEKGTTYPLNDSGDSDFLRDKLAGKFLHCAEKNSWLYFENGVWTPDVTRKIELTAERLFEARKNEAKNISDVEARMIFLSHIASLAFHPTKKRIIENATSKLPAKADDFDNNNFLFNCPNGTLDLKTFNFYQHKPEEMHSKIGGVKYDPGAKVPDIFLKFIETTFEGDSELISYVQKMLGFTLTGDASRQEFYILWGKGGNGKSQLIATLQKIMGKYALGMPAKRIMKTKFDSNDTYMAQLRNIRALFCSEGDEHGKVDPSLVKQLTDENMPFNVAQKYEKPQEFILKLKPFLIMNPEPNNIEDNATWRRIRVVPFTNIIPESERVYDLANVMLRAGESGIFNWYVEGLKKYWSEGLETPEKVKVTTSKYKAESDVIQQFINTCCEVGDGYSVPSTMLLSAYREWSGRNLTTARLFTPAINGKGFKTARKGESKTTVFTGLRLIDNYGNSSIFGG